jgi:hypothetical protein
VRFFLAISIIWITDYLNNKKEITMKNKYDNIFWGILLILAAGLTLAQQQGLVGKFTPQFWALAFGGLSVVFFIRYLLAGLRFWGWLFPVSIFAALGGMVWLASSHQYPDAAIAAPFFGAMAIPFLVAFGFDFRKNWWALIPALASILFGAVVIFGDRLPGEVIGAGFMFAIAIPFLTIYFINRRYSWALIPGFIMAAVGSIILLGSLLNQWMGGFVLFIIALPFFYVYFKQTERWWALIPAGLLASIGVNALLTVPLLGKFAQSTLPVGIMFLGWTATFGWLWRQREKSPTAWARIPALVCGVLAALLLVIGSLTAYGFTFALIAGGLSLIYFGLRPRKDTITKEDHPRAA